MQLTELKTVNGVITRNILKSYNKIYVSFANWPVQVVTNIAWYKPVAHFRVFVTTRSLHAAELRTSCILSVTVFGDL